MNVLDLSQPRPLRMMRKQNMQRLQGVLNWTNLTRGMGRNCLDSIDIKNLFSHFIYSTKLALQSTILSFKKIP